MGGIVSTVAIQSQSKIHKIIVMSIQRNTLLHFVHFIKTYKEMFPIAHCKAKKNVSWTRLSPPSFCPSAAQKFLTEFINTVFEREEDEDDEIGSGSVRDDYENEDDDEDDESISEEDLEY